MRTVSRAVRCCRRPVVAVAFGATQGIRLEHSEAFIGVEGDGIVSPVKADAATVDEQMRPVLFCHDVGGRSTGHSTGARSHLIAPLLTAVRATQWPSPPASVTPQLPELV